MTTRSRRLLSIATVLLLALLLTGPAAVAQSLDEALWADVAESTLKATIERAMAPGSYRALALDKVLLREILDGAPLESRAGLKGGEAVLSLPLPEGGFGRFRIVESPIMAPELAARFPEISTYRGQGIDDPAATARFDLTPAGFHAMILSPEGDVYVDPYSREDTDHYVSYRTRDYVRQGEAFTCHVESHGPQLPDPRTLIPAKAVSGSTLRTYRLAVAATGEYTAFHGGTVAQGQAAIVTAMNRTVDLEDPVARQGVVLVEADAVDLALRRRLEVELDHGVGGDVEGLGRPAPGVVLEQDRVGAFDRHVAVGVLVGEGHRRRRRPVDAGRTAAATLAGVGGLVAGLAARARIGPVLAAECGVAGLGAVAEKAVVAQAVVRRVVARVGGLVAGVDRAADAVVAGL